MVWVMKYKYCRNDTLPTIGESSVHKQLMDELALAVKSNPNTVMHNNISNIHNDIYDYPNAKLSSFSETVVPAQTIAPQMVPNCSGHKSKSGFINQKLWSDVFDMLIIVSKEEEPNTTNQVQLTLPFPKYNTEYERVLEL